MIGVYCIKAQPIAVPVSDSAKGMADAKTV